MRKPGTDLMATGVILGSTALAVVATLALARASSETTQDSTAECTPLEAHWAVTYSVSVDGAGASGQSAPVRWRWHTRVPGLRAAQQAVHRCRHLTVVTHRIPHVVVAARQRSEDAAEEADAVRQRLEVVKERLQAVPRSR